MSTHGNALLFVLFAFTSIISACALHLVPIVKTAKTTTPVAQAATKRPNGRFIMFASYKPLLKIGVHVCWRIFNITIVEKYVS